LLVLLAWHRLLAFDALLVCLSLFRTTPSLARPTFLALFTRRAAGSGSRTRISLTLMLAGPRKTNSVQLVIASAATRFGAATAAARLSRRRSRPRLGRGPGALCLHQQPGLAQLLQHQLDVVVAARAARRGR